MSYIYVVQMNIPAQHEAEFNRVYDTEHVPMLSRKVRTFLAEDTSMALAQENRSVPFARSA